MIGAEFKSNYSTHKNFYFRNTYFIIYIFNKINNKFYRQTSKKNKF